MSKKKRVLSKKRDWFWYFTGMFYAVNLDIVSGLIPEDKRVDALREAFSRIDLYLLWKAEEDEPTDETFERAHMAYDGFYQALKMLTPEAREVIYKVRGEYDAERMRSFQGWQYDKAGTCSGWAKGKWWLKEVADGFFVMRSKRKGLEFTWEQLAYFKTVEEAKQWADDYDTKDGAEFMDITEEGGE